MRNFGNIHGNVLKFATTGFSRPQNLNRRSEVLYYVPGAQGGLFMTT